MSSFSTVNPQTNQNLHTYHYLSVEVANQKIKSLHQEFLSWRNFSFADRGRALCLIASALRTHAEKLANQMQKEMGKKLEEGLAEVEKCAKTCEFYAAHAETYLTSQVVKDSPYLDAQVVFKPLGVIFAIMPWNFPLWQVFRFAAPALMAGNVVALKHADLTAGTAELIEDIFRSLEIGSGVLLNLPVDHAVAAKLIANPFVSAVTFTGSTEGGRAVAIEAARNLKKTVLELGGSDAYLVFEDADLNLAAKICAKSRLQNVGQSCVAAKRFIVLKSVADEFCRLLAMEMSLISLAPLAAKRFQEKIVTQVEHLKNIGGKVILGGDLTDSVGSCYPATVILFEQNSAELHDQEIFGPVAIVVVVQDEQEALTIANSSLFGLGGAIFSKNIEKARNFAKNDLEAGFVAVNDFVKSDPRIPFGGIKQSGYGRELGSFGILEFVNIKTIGVGIK